MWQYLENLKNRYEKESHKDYYIKKFIRSKINIAFEEYLKSKHQYISSKFQRDKVNILKQIGIDEYTAYHITRDLEEMELDGRGEPIFPKRGKNITEENLYKILSFLDVDLYWFFIEPEDQPVRFSSKTTLSIGKSGDNFSKNIDKGVKEDQKIPIFTKMEQFSDQNSIKKSVNIDLINLLSNLNIEKNEYHPLFKFPHYAFVKVKNSLYLTDLWDQDIREGTFLTFNRVENSFNVEKIEEQSNIDLSKYIFLGKILIKIENL